VVHHWPGRGDLHAVCPLVTRGYSADMTAHVASDSTAPSPASPVTADGAPPSTGELVQRLSTQLTALVRAELALARAELKEKGKHAGLGAGLASAGAVLALFGVAALLTAAIAAIALALPVWLAALIVGVAVLIVAGLLALAGRSQLRRATPPMPSETVEGVRRDVEILTHRTHR